MSGLNPVRKVTHSSIFVAILLLTGSRFLAQYLVKVILGALRFHLRAHIRDSSQSSGEEFCRCFGGKLSNGSSFGVADYLLFIKIQFVTINMKAFNSQPLPFERTAISNHQLEASGISKQREVTAFQQQEESREVKATDKVCEHAKLFTLRNLTERTQLTFSQDKVKPLSSFGYTREYNACRSIGVIQRFAQQIGKCKVQVISRIASSPLFSSIKPHHQ